ncbi:MAG: hypothetical protein M1839_009042 [Geoglossum umbratile]|nr:MAG: hypothetical protein M1839_009042 [Geoglossum umbratile]
MCHLCKSYGRFLPNCLGNRRQTPSPTPPISPVPPSSQSDSQHSGGSTDSTLSTTSLQSLTTLTNQVSHDLNTQDTLVTRLRTWLRTVDPAAYQRNTPWSQQMVAAYDNYKARGAALTAAHQRYHEFLTTTNRNATAEQHQRRADLAVVWGEAAVRAAESRLRFIEMYRNAYSSANSIGNHIDTGVGNIQSGRNAVIEARRNREGTHTTSPKIVDEV